MKLELKDMMGRLVRHVDVRDDVFGASMNQAIVHQVMVGQLANARQGTAAARTRSEVSGGGAKPRPQKHSGRSRQGTIRAPHWKGGGVVFPPKPRSFRQRTPKRMKRLSLLSMISDKARTGNLVILERLELETPKTKGMVRVLDAIDVDGSVLLVADGSDRSTLRTATNIPNLKMLPADLLNTVDLLNHLKLVMTLDAVRRAEELWGGPFVRQRTVGQANGEGG